MTRPEEKELLKQLAKLGGMHGHVYTSSGELAERIGVSQQTASRKILELLESEFISRRMGTRKQLIRITPKGLDILRKEYAEYKALFHGGEKMPIRGKVVKGLGEGQYYISREGYSQGFKKLLGYVPFPGTLNLEVEPLDREKMFELKELEGLVVDEFESEGRTFGAVKCFRAVIGGLEGAAIFPVRTHYTTVLELISPYNLREKLDLQDGADVTVEVGVG